jgi:hypothetical protein
MYGGYRLRAANRFTKGELMNQSTTLTGYTLAGISGVALVVVMLLFAWFGFPNSGGIDAFKSFHDWVLFFLIFTAFAGMALALLGRAGTRVDLPVTLSAIATALGTVSLIILIIYLISPPSFSVSGFGSVGLDRKIGIWLGLIATAGVAIGGYMAMQEEGTSFGDQADRVGGGPRDTGTTAPPPPPPPPPSSGP